MAEDSLRRLLVSTSQVGTQESLVFWVSTLSSADHRKAPSCRGVEGEPQSEASPWAMGSPLVPSLFLHAVKDVISVERGDSLPLSEKSLNSSC
jgi:hypothetical protein